MHNKFITAFPNFAQHLAQGLGGPVEEILPGMSETDIAALEKLLGIPLPNSYRTFLKITQGFWLKGGMIQFHRTPFFHELPPSQGMLCFAEFFLMADGDQALFDVKNGLIDGDYPIYYYDHEWQPARVIKLADSFKEWLEEVLVKEYDF